MIKSLFICLFLMLFGALAQGAPPNYVRNWADTDAAPVVDASKRSTQLQQTVVSNWFVVKNYGPIDFSATVITAPIGGKNMRTVSITPMSVPLQLEVDPTPFALSPFTNFTVTWRIITLSQSPIWNFTPTVLVFTNNPTTGQFGGYYTVSVSYSIYQVNGQATNLYFFFRSLCNTLSNIHQCAVVHYRSSKPVRHESLCCGWFGDQQPTRALNPMPVNMIRIPQPGTANYAPTSDGTRAAYQTDSTPVPNPGKADGKIGTGSNLRFIPESTPMPSPNKADGQPGTGSNAKPVRESNVLITYVPRPGAANNT